MQTVEQIEKSITDDGTMVPTESGKAGDQDFDAGSQNGIQREWEDLIASPKFHEVYTEHISEIIKKRLKTERESKTILDHAATLLGVETPEELPARIEQMMHPAMRDWASEEAAVREKYPEFDLQRQREDPVFASLLQGFGASTEVSLIKLYELFHLDSLKAAAAQDAAEKTASRLLGAVQQRLARPQENGLRADAAQERGRVSHLTRAQRAALAGRAAKGEHITF